VPVAYESWGRIATEAMAAGIPVIAHPTPGLEENLGGAGIFVDRDDLDGWRRALQTLAMPGPYKAARRRALQRSEELRADEDLARWCDEVERAVERGWWARVGAVRRHRLRTLRPRLHVGAATRRWGSVLARGRAR